MKRLILHLRDLREEEKEGAALSWGELACERGAFLRGEVHQARG
jgi:hypothetical protein